MKINFTKMHGLGNDFIFIDGRKLKIPNFKKVAKSLCNRRFGIGADQILILGNSRKADFRMEIYNADGGEVEMCGNGLRCLTKYVMDHKLSKKAEMRVETRAGVQTVRALPRGRYQVDMGEPIMKGPDIPVRLSGRIINRPIRVDGREFRATCLSMGNPHCVVFVEDLKNYPVAKNGPVIETGQIFPKKTNVEFVKVISSTELEMRVWERGAGETLACGSGACAAAVAAALNGFVERKVQVHLAGGTLQIEWPRETNRVLMTGLAETVFEGMVEI